MTSTRLASGWWVAAVMVFSFVIAGFGVLAAVTSSGVLAVAYSLLVVAWATAVVALVVAVVLPRSAEPPAAGADGSVVLRAPRALVWCSVGAWLLLLCSAAAMLGAMLTDFSSIEAPGAAVAVVLGAVASLPELVRLVRGRLHPWRLTLTGEGFTYQGYRHVVSEPWSAVRRAEVTHGKASGVTLDLKGSRPDVLVPAASFLVAPHLIAAEVHRRVRR